MSEYVKELSDILLRRKDKIILPDFGGVILPPEELWKRIPVSTRQNVLTFVKNLNAYGYTVSAKVFERLQLLDSVTLHNVYNAVTENIKQRLGADKKYRPMYPGFPRQVMELPRERLFINAIFHYLTGGQWMPYECDDVKAVENEAETIGKLTVISLGTTEDLMEIFTNLWKSKTSISPQDKEDLAAIMKNVHGIDYRKYVPEEIPLKENAALFGKLTLECVKGATVQIIAPYFKTATDILRLVVGLSDGDLSLAEKSKLRSLKRRERNAVMYLLANLSWDSMIEDMFRYKNRWIYVGQFLHPGEFKNPMFDKVLLAFSMLRADDKPLMFAGKVQKAINDGDMRAAVNILSGRPGEFARLLDKLLREDKSSQNYVADCFKKCADKVSTPVLWQVYAHFIQRLEEANNPANKSDVRVFFPKGNVAKALVIGNDLPAIDARVCKTIVNAASLGIVHQYKSREPLGKVYLSPEFKNYLVPFSQRSASKTSKIVVRGSKLQVEEGTKVVRSFIWWTNTKKGRIDVDLSALVLNERWGYQTHLSYTNLRDGSIKSCHSGDITNGGDVNGDGVAEFIDIDIDSVLNKGGRYVVFQIFNYSGIKFSDMENLRFGWMERDAVNDRAIFEPRKVKMNMDVTAESTVAIPVIFDCKQRRYIWCDLNLGLNGITGYRTYCGGNNLESNIHGVTASCYGIANIHKPDLFRLIRANVMSRPDTEFTENRDEADVIFDTDNTAPKKIISDFNPQTGKVEEMIVERDDYKLYTPFDFDYFVGQLL